MPDPKPPFRLARRNRRILLVLLSGASNLTDERIGTLASVSYSRLGALLVQLQGLGWVVQGNAPVNYRAVYSLTRKGRIGAEDLLDLEVPDAPPAMLPAPVADALPAGPAPLHAHEITPADAALIRMMAGATFGPDSRVTLPSGKTITGAEMARWLEAEDDS